MHYLWWLEAQMQAPVIPMPLLTARLLTFSFISTFANSAQLYVCQVSQAHLRSGARKLRISKVTLVPVRNAITL